MDAVRRRPGPATGALALLAATAAALALSAGADSRPSRAPAGDERADLATVAIEATPGAARRVERVRALDFDSVPDPEVLTSAELGALEQREIRRRGALEGLAADEAAVRITGLLQPEEQLEAAIGSSEELAAAAYDPRSDRLYVISDAVPATAALIEFLLAHELTHALEDQRFGLADVSALESDDEALAQLALVEGTATAVMVDYAGRHLNPLELGLAAAGLDGGTGDVPKFVVDQLEWTYFGGMRWVNALRRLGGGWKLVDYALENRPPATTEQVLHPLKYVRDERATEVRVAPGELSGAGWRRADRGVIGELGTRILLELGVDRRVAARAAAGWEGDRYELWRRDVSPAACTGSCRGDLVLAVHWEVERPRDARELIRGLGGYATQGLEAEFEGAYKLDDGALALAADDAEVAAVFAPTPGLAVAAATEQIGN